MLWYVALHQARPGRQIHCNISQIQLKLCLDFAQTNLKFLIISDEFVLFFMDMSKTDPKCTPMYFSIYCYNLFEGLLFSNSFIFKYDIK